MIAGKVWGATTVLRSGKLFEAHRLSIKPQSQCSLHMHRFKWNGFLVLTGTLFIDVAKNDYALVDETTLRAGDFTEVKPGEYHRFRTGEDGCEAVEFYYLEELSEDIVRKDHGSSGVAPSSTTFKIVTPHAKAFKRTIRHPK